MGKERERRKKQREREKTGHKKKSVLSRVFAILFLLLLLAVGGLGFAAKVMSDRRQEAVETVRLAEE